MPYIELTDKSGRKLKMNTDSIEQLQQFVSGTVVTYKDKNGTPRVIGNLYEIVVRETPEEIRTLVRTATGSEKLDMRFS